MTSIFERNMLHSIRKVAATLTRAAAFSAVLTLLLSPAPALHAQELPGQLRVDSIALEGNQRVTRERLLELTGLEPGQVLDFRGIQAALKAMWRSGDFRDIQIRAIGAEDGPVTLVFHVEEQPIVRDVRFTGLEHADGGAVKDSVGLLGASPYSQAQVAEAKQLVRSMLAEKGIPFARIDDRLEPVEGSTGIVDLVLDVTEGNRVSVAEVVVRGNEHVSKDEIVGAMALQPEGFWWFQGGSYDESSYEDDVLQNIPQLYASRGYLDFQVLSDTLVVDPETGKARLEMDVQEGPQYRIAQFQIEGNDYITEEILEPLFRHDQGGILRSFGIGGGEQRAEEQLGRVFDRVAFQDALTQVQELYANQGFIFAQVVDQVEKSPPGAEGEPATVAVTVQIQEGQPAYFDEIAIQGNDYTHEWVIRDKIFILPGDVYSQQRLIQSYQSIQSLGFFETPLPTPDILPDPETGEVDVTFNVAERQTGSVNFGTSVGGGYGLAGFIGYDQPNLFGQAKEGHLRWDFGRYLSNFTLTFSDPALFQSRTSGSISLFNSRDRFYQFRSGQRRRIGGSIRFGFPIPGALRTRFTTGYSLSRTKYELREGAEDTSLFLRDPGTQSQVSLGLARSTLNHPLFPTAGSRQSVTYELNGGPLGGDGDFQRLTAEGTWRVPVGSVGGGAMGGGSGLQFSLGMTARLGAIFGNAENFPFDRFWMGGVQFGQQLRGYDETSITPLGWFPERGGGIQDIERLGDAFLSLTADYAIKLNDQIQLSAFMDAGSLWRDPGNIDPTRLSRGAGFGLQLVTPFGPIGLDYAYGFDKAEPGWQLHFRMGPGF